jgi:hypothetical protein
MNSPQTKAHQEQIKQRLNRLTSTKKAFNKAQQKADALKRQYHRSAFLVLYGHNQNRNQLTQQEIAALRNTIQYAKRLFMTKRAIGNTLNANTTRLVLSKIN